MKLATRIFRRSDWYVTSPFGYRIHPLTGIKTMHNGCDYGTNIQKWPQYALENGTVTQAGTDAAGGIFAWITYQRLGIEVLHYHLSSLSVRAGQAVTANTLVGLTGMTGGATGIHLHLGVKRGGVYIDPHPLEYTEAGAPGTCPYAEPSKTLKKGSRGDGVSWVQWHLNARASAGLAVDGDFGALTDAATRNFQRSRGLGVDGEVGALTRAALACPYAEPEVVLRKNSSGDGVRWAQWYLNRRNGAGLVVDGSFGVLTDAAVRAWQKKIGITIDGAVGANTRARLKN